MNVYTDYWVDRLEKHSHMLACSWHRSPSCDCKRPDVVITDSTGQPFRGFSDKGYEVRLSGGAPHGQSQGAPK